MKQRSEPAKQFDEIFQEHHDPRAKEKKRILDNRSKREEITKQDHGL